MTLPAPAKHDPKCAKCGAWLVAIAPAVEPVWPYEGLELACPACEGLVCVDVVRDWWRRAGKESA